jgi:uncharacterized protein
MGIFKSIRSWFAPPAPATAAVEPPIELQQAEPRPERASRPTFTLYGEGAAFLLEALGRMGSAPAHDSNANPFDASKLTPPPGVGPLPTGKALRQAALAMDDATFGGVASWAHEGLSGFLGPREGFIGFPELAIMAQRPEYRSPVEIIATEATRKKAKFQAVGDKDKSEKIAKIEAEFDRLNVWAVLRQVSEHDGFYGRGHIFIDVGVDLEDRDELKKPIGSGADDLSKLKIAKGALKAIRTVEPVWVWPIAYNSINPLSGRWYRPETWFCMSTEVHKTRLLTFISREVPDLFKPAYMFGGQSLTQIMRPVVENWLTTRKSVGDIVKRFSLNVIKVNLAEAISSGNASKLLQRVRLFNESASNFGTMILDKEAEEFVNVSVPLSGLDLLQAQAQEHMSSLSRIPIIKLLGIQPAGLNASSEGELRAFADFVHSYQESFFRPNLTTILNLVQLSLFGEVHLAITFEFEPLTEELDELEKAQAAQQVTTGAANAFSEGVLDRASALRQIKTQLESLGVTSIVDDRLIREAENEPPMPGPEELKSEAEMVRAEKTGSGGGSEGNAGAFLQSRACVSSRMASSGLSAAAVRRAHAKKYPMTRPSRARNFALGHYVNSERLQQSFGKISRFPRDLKAPAGAKRAHQERGVSLMTILHINSPANALALGYADGRNVFGPRDARYAHRDVETGVVMLSNLPWVEASAFATLKEKAAALSSLGLAE